MLDIDLKVNDVPIRLGVPLTRETRSALQANGIKKPGFLTNRLIPRRPDEEVLFSKNPKMSLFGGDVVIKANLWPRKVTVSSGDVLRGQWGTSFYAWIVEDRLDHIVLAVIDHLKAAMWFYGWFGAAAKYNLGRPIDCENETADWLNLWKDHESFVQSVLHWEKPQVANAILRWNLHENNRFRAGL